jgi:hypothetical protein
MRFRVRSRAGVVSLGIKRGGWMIAFFEAHASSQAPHSPHRRLTHHPAPSPFDNVYGGGLCAAFGSCVFAAQERLSSAEADCPLVVGRIGIGSWPRRTGSRFTQVGVGDPTVSGQCLQCLQPPCVLCVADPPISLLIGYAMNQLARFGPAALSYAPVPPSHVISHCREAESNRGAERFLCVK